MVDIYIKYHLQAQLACIQPYKGLCQANIHTSKQKGTHDCKGKHTYCSHVARLYFVIINSHNDFYYIAS